MTKITTKKDNKRIIIVLAFILLTILIGYVLFRGKYLEVLEIGEEYVEIFWKNIKKTWNIFPVMV